MSTGNNIRSLEEVLGKLVRSQSHSIENDILNLDYSGPAPYIGNCISMLKNWIIVCDIDSGDKVYSTFDTRLSCAVEELLKERFNNLAKEIRKKEEYKAILRKKRLIRSVLKEFFSQYHGSSYSISSFYPDGDFYLECTIPSIFHEACWRLISWNSKEELLREINRIPAVLEEERQKEMEEEKEKMIAKLQYANLSALLDEKIVPLGITYDPNNNEWTKCKGIRFYFAEEPKVPLIGPVRYLSRQYFNLDSDLEKQVDSLKEQLAKTVSDYKAIEDTIQSIDGENLDLWTIYIKEGYCLVKRESAYTFAAIESSSDENMKEKLLNVLESLHDE